MSDEKKPFEAGEDLNSGVALFATEDWIKLMVFFRMGAYDSPGTEAAMRLRLGMQSQDPISPEINKTISHFALLEGISKDFLNKTVDEMLGLADDIKHYELQAVTVYERLGTLIDYFDLGFDSTADTQKKLDELVKLWKAGTEQGMSGKIKVRIKSLVEGLAKDAEGYAGRAERLQTTINGPGGYYERLTQCSNGFQADAADFTKKFGEGGEEIKSFTALYEGLKVELAALRKKENDEVIVLSTSPVYLIIPFFGPLILAGVDIGVGIDLAHVRAEISAKVDRMKVYSDKLDATRRFMGYYTGGKKLASDMVTSIAAVLPRIETLGRSWRAIGADLTRIADSLKVDGASQINGEDWNKLVATLAAATRSWKEIGLKADRFRSFAEPQVAASVDELFRKAANG